MKDEHQTDTLPTGELIDLDSYDWGEYRLTRKQKLFVIWYTTPNQAGYLSPCKAAQKAGYKKKAAYVAKTDLIKNNPKIRDLIKKFTDDNLKVSVADACKTIIAQKIKRATYNINDFYESKTIEVEGKEGPKEIFIPAAAKDLESIPEDKRELIDNIQVNNSGIVIYQLPNKDRESKDLLELNAKMNQEKSTGDYDVETTVDLIKENLAQIKTSIRVKNQSIRENAENYIENDQNLPEFD